MGREIEQAIGRAVRGELTPRPAQAIFADVQTEPNSIKSGKRVHDP